MTLRVRKRCDYPGCSAFAEVLLDYPTGDELYCGEHYRMIYTDDSPRIVPLDIRPDATALGDRCDVVEIRQAERRLGCVGDGYEDILQEWLDRRKFTKTAYVWCSLCERAFPTEKLLVLRSRRDRKDRLGCADPDCHSAAFFPWTASTFPLVANPDYPEIPELLGWYPTVAPACVVMMDDGAICGRSARFIDADLGGSVCDRHRRGTRDATPHEEPGETPGVTKLGRGGRRRLAHGEQTLRR